VAGLRVSAFATAEAYLSDPDRADVSFLVIDVRLPGMDGLELHERVRAECSTPALFITGHEDEQVRSRALAGGAIGFFVKPFDNRQLVDAIRGALGEP
jgi:FixJ family two-component response regulator